MPARSASGQHRGPRSAGASTARSFRCGVAGFAFILIGFSAAPASAQSDEYNDPLRFIRWPVEDVTSLVSGVTANRLAIVGAGAAVYALAQRDPGLRDAVMDAAPSPHSPLLRAAEELGNVRTMRPAALMLFLGSLPSGDPRFQDAAFTSLEAVVVANLFTSALKAAFGRARPYQNEGATTFNPFSGDTSFPSGHTTTAFALVTPWLLYYPNPFTAGLVVLSAGTAVARVAGNFHWVSDVVAGGSIGFVTAYAFTRLHMNRSETLRVSPIVSHEGAGIMVALRP